MVNDIGVCEEVANRTDDACGFEMHEFWLGWEAWKLHHCLTAEGRFFHLWPNIALLLMPRKVLYRLRLVLFYHQVPCLLFLIIN